MNVDVQPVMATLIGGWEAILILAILLVLYGAKRLPELMGGMNEGLRLFLKATDETAHDAGKSVGGILGKPAGEALTPGNETAELYDPAAWHESNSGKMRRNRMRRFLKWLIGRIRS